MRDRAVVLTYPAHFLLTKLTIESIKQHLSDIKRITVLVDDMSQLAWKDYKKHCADFYDAEVLFLSDFELQQMQHLKKHPWLKQQIIKMYLDVVFPADEEIFFTDGDVVFYHYVDYWCVPYFRMKPSHITEQQVKYISLALGVDYKPISVDGRIIVTSGPPFRDIELCILSQVRRAIETNTNLDFTSYHVSIMQDNTQSVSEWELLEYYKHKILDKPLDFQYYHLQYLNKTLNRDPGKYFGSCFCSDREFGEAWWKLNTEVDYSKYWHLLPAKKYF